MKVIKIDKKDIFIGLEKAKEKYSLYGPVQEENTSKFKKLDKDEACDFSKSSTALSPKSIVFPQSETMLEYTTDPNEKDCNILQPTKKDYSQRAIIGIRPYDAYAMLIMEKNFDTKEYRDPYWCDAYKACTLIGLAVSEPDTLDFSTSTNTGPFDTKGLDVLLVDNGENFLAQVVSKKGEKFLKAANWSKEVDDGQTQIEALSKKANEKIKSKISFDKIKSKQIMDLYEDSFWEEKSFACINCGTCTFVCPTCWCFDISDENHKSNGIRCKNWDSCMFPLFTLHTTGHNPRSTKLQRVRQRFMHKLKYYLDKYDDGIMCVGCGRCIKMCPVNIDIREIAKDMNK